MRYRSLAAIAGAAALLAACSSGDSTGAGGNSVASVSVQPDPLTLSVGDTARLTTQALSSTGEVLAAPVSYQSLNPSVATVSAAGTVTGVAVGTTQIVATAGGRTATITVNVVAQTGLRSFNVNTEQGCTNPNFVQFRTVATSQHAILMEDTRNPAGGFSTAEYQAIADRFDAQVWPTDVNAFGMPSDIDQNGKVIVLFTRAVNELTPAHANFIIGGFFYSRDLFPRTATPDLGACPGSNYGEMFYMLAADPQGTINGNVRTKTYVSDATIGTLAHEFQHLINSSRRLYVNNANTFETVWLDEGLAHIAEELNFYTASGLSPRQNLDQQAILSSTDRINAFNEFQINNFGRFAEYLKNPPPNSPYAGNDSLATRGATWSLLRYSADRKGQGDQTFFNALVNSPDSGMVNLSHVVGAELPAYVRDWEVANYGDDVASDARFQQPSWNFRDVFAHKAFGGYPLQVIQLASGASNTVNIKAGSAAYFRFGVASGATGDVRVAAANTTVGNACTPVTLAVGQAVQVDATTTPAFCAPAGEYALVVGYPVLTPEQFARVTVAAQNVTAAAGPPTPDRLPGAGSLSPTPFNAGQSGASMADNGFEIALRVRERAELSPLIHRGGAPRFSISGATAPSGVVLTLLRTK